MFQNERILSSVTERTHWPCNSEFILHNYSVNKPTITHECMCIFAEGVNCEDSVLAGEVMPRRERGEELR